MCWDALKLAFAALVLTLGPGGVVIGAAQAQPATAPQATGAPVEASPAPAAAYVPSMPEARLYNKQCRKCHGWGGSGQTRLGAQRKVRDYTDAQWQAEVSDARIRKAIAEGWTDPTDPKRKMPPFKDRVSEEELQSLVRIVRAFGGRPGPFPSRAAKEAAKFSAP